MTDPATPLTPPDEAPFPPCAEGEAWARPMLRRELEVLGELAELGLTMARAITDQATGAATAEPVIQGDLPLAFSRVSRAVRMAVLLQAKLIQDIKTGGRKAAPGEDEDEVPTKWEIEWVDVDPGDPLFDELEERDQPSTERAENERRERLERDDIHAAVMGRPKEEVIAEIRRDLGVAPEASDLPLERQRKAGSDQSHAIDLTDREAVVGAGQAHHPTAFPASDSS
jgi:hypothetical protein